MLYFLKMFPMKWDIDLKQVDKLKVKNHPLLVKDHRAH